MFSRRSPDRELVRRNAAGGFPTDYLVARVKGRRTTLVADWPALVARGLPPDMSDERIWEALLRELEWLHDQMNQALGDTFAPLFALFELKTIVLCLRNRAAGRTIDVERLLGRSLLADEVRGILLRGPDVRSTVGTLARTLACTAEACGELETAYDNGHLKGFENGLMRVYLQQVAAAGLHPAIRRFFVAFIDLRNVMLLYKHLRWGLGDDEPFISGGSLEWSRLQDVRARRDEAGFDALVKQVTGLRRVSAAAADRSLETVLLASMTRRLDALCRESDDIGLILAYAWRLYAQARNLAVLHHGAGLDRPTLERELIL